MGDRELDLTLISSLDVLKTLGVLLDPGALVDTEAGAIPDDLGAFCYLVSWAVNSLLT